MDLWKSIRIFAKIVILLLWSVIREMVNSKNKIAEFIKNYIYSRTDYCGTHYLYKFLGIKIKLTKPEINRLKKQNDYYYYKKHNLDITTVPKAKGDLRNMQLALLAMLVELDKVCKKNDLEYWLDGGTQIGAVRHKGFIPWDDDIDCGMLRDDYNKLIEAFEKEHSDIYAAYYRDSRLSGTCFIKIQHRKNPNLFIDIFPFDMYDRKLNSDEKVQKSKLARKWRDYISDAPTSQMSNEELLKMVYEIRDSNVLEHGLGKKEDKPDIFWGLEYPHRWKNWMYDYETFFPLKKCEFEGYEFPIINNPDVFLTGVYGNYMSYPNKLGCGHNMFKQMSIEEREVIEELVKTL